MKGDDAYCDRCYHYADDVNFLLKTKDECMCMCHMLNEDILYKQKLELTFARINKMCDKCDNVWPEHISICKCGNDRLRSFKIHNNLKELEKNYAQNELFYVNFMRNRK